MRVIHGWNISAGLEGRNRIRACISRRRCILIILYGRLITCHLRRLITKRAGDSRGFRSVRSRNLIPLGSLISGLRVLPRGLQVSHIALTGLRIGLHILRHAGGTSGCRPGGRRSGFRIVPLSGCSVLIKTSVILIHIQSPFPSMFGNPSAETQETIAGKPNKKFYHLYS